MERLFDGLRISLAPVVNPLSPFVGIGDIHLTPLHEEVIGNVEADRAGSSAHGQFKRLTDGEGNHIDPGWLEDPLHIRS
jgi:hypothetical protein